MKTINKKIITIRNSQGDWIVGLRIAKAYNLTPLEIATDSTEVIRMIANGNIYSLRVYYL